MGDWTPDKSITISATDPYSLEGEDALYDLHLWTMTEEVKKRAQEE